MHEAARWFGFALTVASTLLTTAAVATEPATSDYEIVQLAEGVHAWLWTDPLADPIEGNALFIINDEDVVVVDSGLFPSTAARMIAELERLTDKPVRYIVNTHWHDDHHGGNHLYLESWPGAEVIAHSHTREDIVQLTYAARDGVLTGYAEQIGTIERWLDQGHDDAGKPFDDARRKRAIGIIALLQRAIDELANVPPAPPTLLVDHRLELKRGERTIEIRWLGEGNTRGDLIVYLPKERIVATGDLLVHPVPFGIGSNYREWIDTLRAVGEIEADLLFPGHGPIFRDRAYLEQVRGLLRDLVSRVDDAVARELTLEQTQQEVTLADWKATLTKGDTNLERAFDAYFVAPAVKRAWEIANGVAAEAEGLYP